MDQSERPDQSRFDALRAQLVRDWCLDGRAARQLASSIDTNLRAVSRRLKSAAKGQDWEKIDGLVTFVTALSDHLDMPDLKQFVDNLREACRNKDPKQVQSLARRLRGMAQEFAPRSPESQKGMMS